MNQKEAVEEYQCPGCVCGNDYECYEKINGTNLECSKHVAGTIVYNIGQIFLGLPKGFNRLGPGGNHVKIYIFRRHTDGWGSDKWNIPVWKHLDKHGNTLVRGISPRISIPYIHIFLENCMHEISCIDITDKDSEEMD